MRNEKGVNERNILCAEVVLSKYFAERPLGVEAPAAEVLREVREAAQGLRFRKAEIREARKRLGILSAKEGEEYFWRWGLEDTPESTWTRKSRELVGGRNHERE